MASRFNIPTVDVGPGIKPASGAKLFFFEAGTDTDKNTFTDAGAGTPNSNPVIADSNGVFPDIFLNGTYKVILTDKNDVQTGFGEKDPVTESSTVDSTDAHIDRLNPSTMAIAIVDETFQLGDIFRVQENVAGSGGAGHWKVITKGTTPKVDLPNGLNIVASTADLTLAFILQEVSPDVLQLGTDLSDASTQMQLIATQMDDEQLRSMKIPNYKETYTVDSTITIVEPGIRVFGEQGPTYDRGNGKFGWIETKAGNTFDFSGSRTGPNLADNWVIDHIGIKQQSGEVNRTHNGLVFTTRTNGPDRGVTITEYSAIGLKYGVAVLGNADLATSIATMSINGGVYQGCELAVFSEGMIQGFSMTNTQCEQNVAGIKLSLTGGCTVTDNMLEGQPNVLEITIPPVTGGSPLINFSNNYLEANGGDFVLKASSSTSSATAIIGPNLLQSLTATDYAVFTGGTWHIEMYDRASVTIAGNTVFSHGSKPIVDQNDSYNARTTTDTQMPIVFIDDMTLPQDPTQKGYTANDAIVGTVKQTPFGLFQCAIGQTLVTVTLSCVVNDLITVQILGSFDDTAGGYIDIDIFGGGTPIRRRVAPAIFNSVRGKWTLLTLTVNSAINSGTISFRILGAQNDDTFVAGVSAINHGQDVGQTIVVQPVLPILTP